MQDFTVTFEGRTPLVVHNIRLANPLDPYAKALKEITSRRNKTEDNHLEMLHIEWEGGLYFDDTLGPYLPASYPTACIRQAGSISRKKTGLIRAAQFMAEDGGERIPIEYDGPRSIETLWTDDDYRDVRLVRVNSSRTLRCRPRFPAWKITFRAMLDEEIMDVDIFETICQRAGRNIGLGESAEGTRSRFNVNVEAVSAAPSVSVAA